MESEIITQNEQRQLLLIFLRGIDDHQGKRIKLNMCAILPESHGLLADITQEGLLNVDQVLTIEQLNKMKIAEVEGSRIAIYEKMCVFPKNVAVFNVVNGRLEQEYSNQLEAVLDLAKIVSTFDHFKNDTLTKLDSHFVSSKSSCNLL